MNVGWDKSKPISFIARPEDTQFIEDECRRRGITRSAFIRELVIAARLRSARERTNSGAP